MMNDLLKMKKAIIAACSIFGLMCITNQLWASNYDTISYVKTMDLIKIPIQINGKTYNFIFDTGAQGTFLRSDKAAQMGKETGSVDTLYDGLRNKSIQAFYLVEQLNIGRSYIKNLNAQVLPTNPIFECLEIDGVIGVDVIKQFDWFIDFDKQLLVKIDSIDTHFQKNEEFKRLTLSVQNNIPTIKLSINKHTIDFLFDSGATSSDIDLASYQLVKDKVIGEIEAVTISAVALSSEVKRTDSKIKVYTQPTSDAAFQYLTQFNKTSSMGNKIGNNFWNGNQVYFSLNKQILAYKPLHTLPRGSFGASFSVEDGNMIVKGITYNEAIKRTNLQLGDKIKAINGKVYADKCELIKSSNSFNDEEMVLEMVDGRKIVLIRQ